jgi:uncharacterized membrane protein YciS (DUF1049 family)
MRDIDIVQSKQIKFILAALFALGGLSAFLVYLDNKKHSKLRSEVMDLEKQIKELELQKLKNGKS